MPENNTKVVITKARLSYANLFEPKTINGEGDPKYSVSILFDKKDTATVEKVKAAIKEAINDGKAVLGKATVATLKTPLRDGDAERPDDEAYKGMYFINANSKRKPQVIDQAKRIVEDPEIVYSGCYAHVSVNFYPFSVSGNKGIAAGLGNVMKFKDGARLSGGASAEEDFAEFEAEEDNVDDLI